jgi:hypothetical protein
VVILIAAVVIGAGVLAWSQLRGAGPSETVPLTLGQGSATATQYTLEKVSEPADLVKGLSGRPSLDARGGMLFEFSEGTRQCIWMKDMKFNIASAASCRISAHPRIPSPTAPKPATSLNYRPARRPSMACASGK